METIEALERKLHGAWRGVPGARYQTGLVIDLNGCTGQYILSYGCVQSPGART